MSLVQLIEDIIQDVLLDVHTIMPGKIVSYDHTTRLAVVKPTMKCKLPSNNIGANENLEVTNPQDVKLASLNQIFNTLVVFPVFNGGKSFIHFPLSKDDKGLLLFTSRSIEEYILSKGNEYPVYDFRHHSLSDAIFIPGAIPTGITIDNLNATDVIIQHDSMRFELKATGQVAIKNQTTELLTMIDDLIQTLVTAKTITMMGPQPFMPDTLAALNVIKTKLNTMKV
jgi:hypothetical protein